MDNEAKRLIKGRNMTLILFEAVYKGIGASAVIPFCLWAINISIKSVGVDYITPDNLGYLLNPVVITAVIMSAVIMAVYTLIELAGIMTCFEYAHYGKNIGVKNLIMAGLKRACRAVEPRNLGIVLFAMLIVPAGSFMLSSGFLGELRLPEYIGEVIDATPLYKTGITVLTIAASLLSLRWLYVFNIFFLENKTMRVSARESAQMMKGRYIKTVIAYAWWMAKVAIKLALVCGVLILIALALLFAFSSSDGIYAALMGVIDIVKTVTGFAVSITMLVSSYAWITSRYYAIRSEFGEVDEDKELPEGRTHTRAMTVTAALVSVVFMAASAVGAYWIINSGYVFDDIDVSSIRVVAHRGCGLEAPENTVEAYLKAIEAKADYGEMDVHWTSDKKVVLSHDDNLERTGGVDVNIWDISYDELKKIDRGITFSDEFSGVRYSALEEVLAACKDKLKLVIEIKADGHDRGIEKDVVDLIRKYGYENDCFVASLNYGYLENVKKYDSGIKTLYFAPFALGSVEMLESADAVGVEMTFLTEDIVDSLHAAYKSVFVWTVDETDHIKKCVELGVDYIISNDPANTRYVIEENDDEIFRALLELRGVFNKLAAGDFNFDQA